MSNKSFHIPLAYPNRLFGYFHSQIEQQRRILQQVRRGLPDNLAKHACHCLISRNTLVIYTDSAMWASQLRFYQQAMLNHVTAISREPIAKVQIKIMTVTTGVTLRPEPSVKIPSLSTVEMMEKQSQSIRDDNLKLALQRLNSRLKKLADGE